METVKFVHINILAKDWKTLSQFYIKVFDCKPVYPERNMHGDWIDKMTNIKGVHIKGIHLKLPGYEDGPTLEIFSYNERLEKTLPAQINDIGFAHIAFRVEDISQFINRVLKQGGSFYGELVKTQIENVGELNAVYMRDPEGNIIEIQKWKK